MPIGRISRATEIVRHPRRYCECRALRTFNEELALLFHPARNDLAASADRTAIQFWRFRVHLDVRRLLFKRSKRAAECRIETILPSSLAVFVSIAANEGNVLIAYCQFSGGL